MVEPAWRPHEWVAYSAATMGCIELQPQIVIRACACARVEQSALCTINSRLTLLLVQQAQGLSV